MDLEDRDTHRTASDTNGTASGRPPAEPWWRTALTRRQADKPQVDRLRGGPTARWRHAAGPPRRQFVIGLG